MIPVEQKAEPPNFSSSVRSPGMQFLEQVSHPTAQQFENKAYWQKALPQMRKAYKSICAYSAHWIPHSTGNHSIDHFIPKSQQPALAYEWSNFRYVSARFNSRKGTKIIIDPFELLPDWFVMNFLSFLIHPNPLLLPHQKEIVTGTIVCLHLNSDDDLVNERQGWFTDYMSGEISFVHLQKRAPFIAYEVLRQGINHPNT